MAYKTYEVMLKPKQNRINSDNLCVLNQFEINLLDFTAKHEK